MHETQERQRTGLATPSYGVETVGWAGAAAALLGAAGLISFGHAAGAALAFAGSLYLAAVAMGFRGRMYRSVELLRVSAAQRDPGRE